MISVVIGPIIDNVDTLIGGSESAKLFVPSRTPWGW